MSRGFQRPVCCYTFMNDKKEQHFGVEYACNETGLFFCEEHFHNSGGCCRLLPVELRTEIESAVELYNEAMPKCLFCLERYVAIDKRNHMRECVDKYLRAQAEAKRAGRPYGRDSFFVPESRLDSKMVDEIPFRSKYSSVRDSKGKVLREVKFEENR